MYFSKECIINNPPVYELKPKNLFISVELRTQSIKCHNKTTNGNIWTQSFSYSSKFPKHT